MARPLQVSREMRNMTPHLERNLLLEAGPQRIPQEPKHRCHSVLVKRVLVVQVHEPLRKKCEGSRTSTSMVKGEYSITRYLLPGTWYARICITNITCERSQRSGPIHPTLKTVQFTNPFSSASP